MLNQTLEVTSAVKLNVVLLCIVNALFTLIGIFLNSFVIISMAGAKLHKKLCYFMIFILAVCDVAVVIVHHPVIIFQTLTIFFGSNNSQVYKILGYLKHLIAFSMTALLTMTIERYLALVYPFFHQRFVTKSRLTAIFVFLHFPFALQYIMMSQDSRLSLLAILGAMFLAMLILNYKIYSTVETLRQCPGNVNGPGQRNVAKKRKITLGKVSTCLLALACLFVCYLPNMIVIVIGLSLNGSLGIEMIFFRLWSHTLAAINSSLNSLIFFYKNGTLRRHGKVLIARCCKRVH